MNRFTDIERYADMDESYIEAEPEEYKPKVCQVFAPQHTVLTNTVSRRSTCVLGSAILRVGINMRRTAATKLRSTGMESHRNAKSRLTDTYVVIHLYVGDTRRAYQRLLQNWTDLYISWSPLGTFIATLHRQGVQLWGGASWGKQQRFAHPMVKLIDFSPCENYIVTWSNDPIVVPEGAQRGPQFFSPEDENHNIAVWDVKTGNLLRTFPTTYPEGEDVKKQLQWPALKWSPDDKFVARVTPGQQISVYELPSMGLQGKKSIKIEGVVDFEWCPQGDKDRDEAEAEAKGKSTKKPRENMLAYWTPEVANQPARVTLMNFPSRTLLRQKNLFNVTEVTLAVPAILLFYS